MTEAKPFETSCPKCGAPRQEGVRFCPSCGKDLFALEPEQAGGGRAGGGPARRKSIGLTILLALLFPGLGHIYAGRWRRGLAIMAFFVLALLVVGAMVLLLGASVVGVLCVPIIIIGGLLLFVPFELYQILDAVGSSAAANSGRA